MREVEWNVFPVLGYPPYQESNTGFNAAKKLPTEEDRLAITELFNKKQALMVELQHYEANASSGSLAPESMERPGTAMPTNTRLQVAVTNSLEEVMKRSTKRHNILTCVKIWLTKKFFVRVA